MVLLSPLYLVILVGLLSLGVVLFVIGIVRAGCRFAGIAAAVAFVLFFSSCAAAPMLAGGVTLYKSTKETGPKAEAEFVLFKLEVNHCK